MANQGNRSQSGSAGSGFDDRSHSNQDRNRNQSGQDRMNPGGSSQADGSRSETERDANRKPAPESGSERRESDGD